MYLLSQDSQVALLVSSGFAPYDNPGKFFHAEQFPRVLCDRCSNSSLEETNKSHCIQTLGDRQAERLNRQWERSQDSNQHTCPTVG